MRTLFPLSLRASSYTWASEASRARRRERAAKPSAAEGPFSPLPPVLVSPLACHSRVYFSRYTQIESLLVDQSPLCDETVALSECFNRSNKWKSAPLYTICALNEIKFYQQLTRTRVQEVKISYATGEKQEMSRVQRNSETYSIWLSRASRKTIPLLT